MRDHQHEPTSEWPAIRSVAEKIGCTTRSAEGVAPAELRIPPHPMPVAQLMSEMGLHDVARSRRFKTAVPADVAERPLDLVERDFSAGRPNQLLVSDLTCVATWRGFVYIACATVTDAFSRRIVG